MPFKELLSRVRARIWSLEDRMELRLQIAIATGVLCFALVVTLAIGAALVGRNEAVKVANDRLSDIVVTLTDRIDRGINSRLVLVEHLASLASLRDVWTGDPDELRRMLADTRRALTDTAWIGFAAPDGTVRIADDGAFEGRSVAEYAWFRRGLDGPVVVDSVGESAGQEMPYADPSVRSFVEFGVPVRDAEGGVIGVLGVYLAATWADRIRTTTVVDVDASQEIRVTLVSSNGAVALDRQDAALSLNTVQLNEMLAAGHGAIPDADDGFLTAFSVAGANAGSTRPTWLVVARQSAEVAFRSADKVVGTIVTLGVVVGLMGMLGSMFIADRVSRPFRKLADKAALVGRDSTEMLPRVRGSFEAARLSTVLRALIMRLTYAERSNAEAEDRAAEAERQLNQDIARLRNLAEIDPLTELLNRRAFMEFAHTASRQFDRHRRPFAVLMIDIDRFKTINDNLGHATGDTVIRSVAGAVAGSLRTGDKCARFGGEEFIVLLHEVSTTEAIEVAERIRAAVCAVPVAIGPQGDLFVTVSVGIALADDNGYDVGGVTERADAALYAAKRDGRNRIAFAPAPTAVRRTA
jgi:diguanylate cyclase (GGDEF)-like protein